LGAQHQRWEEVSISGRIFGRAGRDGTVGQRLTLALLSVTMVGGAARFAHSDSNYFFPGNLVVSRSVYDNNPNNVQAGITVLPPNCAVTSGACSPAVTAINDGTYPFVFNNDTVDASFGITSKIILDQITTAGSLVTSLEVPNSSQVGMPPTRDQMVTSFSSKSELALNLSTDHNYLTFMGYLAPIDVLDASNANTPAVVDPTNAVGASVLRAVAQVNAKGQFNFTATNAYSGNNGRSDSE
jgi:hypothetical protein